MRGRRMLLDFSKNPRSRGTTFPPGKTELPHLYCFALQSIILVGGFRKNVAVQRSLSCLAERSRPKSTS